MGKILSYKMCGRCKKEKKNYSDVEKVIDSGYANILCKSCIAEFEHAKELLARRYLGDNIKKVS